MRTIFFRLFLLAILIQNFTTKSNAQLPIWLPKDGLVAWYPFSGNTLDSSGNKNNGSVIGSLSYTYDHLNNSNSALLLGSGRVTTNSSMFNFSYDSSFTISFWVLDKGSSGGRLISTECPEGNFRISTYGNGVYAIQYGSSANYLYDTLQLNVWYHLAYVFDKRNVKLYKNGTLKASYYNNDIEVLNYCAPFTIGAKASPAYDNWNGAIDELTIHNKSLTENQVLSMYNGQIRKSSAIIPSNGLIAWYPFNGNANDESGNGNHGTVYGALSLINDRNGMSNAAYSWPTNGNSGNFIDIGNLTNKVPQSITISAWIYMDGGTTDARVVSMGEAGVMVYGAPSNTSRILKAAYDPAGASIWPSKVSINAKSWHHIVFSGDYQTKTGKFYVDGNLTDSQCCGNVGSVANSNWNIGRKSIAVFNGWGGYIDDVGIWNRVLTSLEISNLYTAANPCTGISGFNPLQDTIRVCGDSVKIDAGSGFESYRWSTGDITQNISVKQSGFYKVVVTNIDGCRASDSSYISIAKAKIFNNDTTIYKGNTLKLFADSIALYNTIDIDGNKYPIGNIDGNYWTLKNLKVSKYRNGDNIPQVTNASQWRNLTSGAWCWYNNDSTTEPIYGKLYNWYAVNDPRGLVPKDWKIPNDNDWNFIINYLGGTSVAGGAMKAIGSTYWKFPNSGATNSSGFNSVASGYCNQDPYNLPFLGFGEVSYFWSTTSNSINSANAVDLYYANSTANINSHARTFGFSIRSIINKKSNFKYAWSTGDTTMSISVAPLSTTTYYFTVSDGISSCTDSIRVAVKEQPLPLNLLDFKATLEGRSVNVKWVTSNEIDSKLFMVSKSKDGIIWDTIAKVASTNTLGVKEYSFVDLQPNKVLNYYRLKIVNKDGSSSYSKIVLAVLGSQAALSVYPNPAKDKVTLQFMPAVGKGSVVIRSLAGNTLYNAPIDLQAGKAIIPIHHLAKGIYAVQLIINHKTQVQTLVVE